MWITRGMENNTSRAVWIMEQATGTILSGVQGVMDAISWEIAVREVRARAGYAPKGRGWFVDRTDGAVCYERGGFVACHVKFLEG